MRCHIRPFCKAVIKLTLSSLNRGHYDHMFDGFIFVLSNNRSTLAVISGEQYLNKVSDTLHMLLDVSSNVQLPTTHFHLPNYGFGFCTLDYIICYS